MSSATQSTNKTAKEQTSEDYRRDSRMLQDSIGQYRNEVRAQQPLMDQSLENVLGQQSVAQVRQQQALGQAAAQSGGNPWAMRQAGVSGINRTGNMRVGESIDKLEFMQGHNRARLGRRLMEEETANRAYGVATGLNQSWNATNDALQRQQDAERQRMIQQGIQQVGAVAAMAGRGF